MSKEREFFQRLVDWYDDDAENVDKFVEEIRTYLAVPRPDFVRLSEEEVSEILSSAYDMYAAVCATENRLVEKSSINNSDPDSVDLQSRCRGDKL